MSNPSPANRPQNPPPSGGNKPPAPTPAKPEPQKPGTPPALTQEEAIKQLLAKMADNDPAKMAEIIHQWLNEDKK